MKALTIKPKTINKDNLADEVEKLAGQEVYAELKKFVGYLSNNTIDCCREIYVHGKSVRGMTFIFNEEHMYEFWGKWVSVNYSTQRVVNDKFDHDVNVTVFPNCRCSISARRLADHINYQLSNTAANDNSNDR